MIKKTKLKKQDLKIYPSARLTDADDGGGAMVGSPLTGKPDELFQAVSDVARTMGAFDMRQIYGAVLLQDRSEALFGAHMIISRPPNSENVSYLLAKSGKYGEIRETAQKRIENYESKTIENHLTLLSIQTKGSRIIQGYQRLNEPLPTIGKKFCLSQKQRGYEEAEQFVQVAKVTSEPRTFVNPSNGNEFERLLVRLELNQALIADFIGADYPTVAGGNAVCKIHDTHVTDGASYYGIQPATEALQRGVLKIKVPAVKEKIVPTVRNEIPLQNLNPAGIARGFFTGAEFNGSRLFAPNKTQFFGVPIIAGTVRISNGRITDKDGTLYNETGFAVGVVDYQAGTMTVDLSGWYTTQFVPATRFAQASDTIAFEITVGNRANNYLHTLPNLPAKGSVIVQFMVGGNWKRLIDDAKGQLKGQAGAGSINYATGDVSITLPEMPDVGSAILIAWGNDVFVYDRSETELSHYCLVQVGQALPPNGVQLRIGSDTLQDDGAGVIQTRHGAGKVNYHTGDILLPRAWQFSPSAQITVQTGEPTEETLTRPDTNHEAKYIFRLNKRNITPRSVVFKAQLLRLTREWTGDNYFLKPFYDDGAGNMIDGDKNVVGTIDYVQGIIALNPEISVTLATWRWESVPTGGLFGGGSGGGISPFFPNYATKRG